MIAAGDYQVNEHAIAVMALTLLALFLFSRERIPVETSSLAIITALAVGFHLFPYEAGGDKVEPKQFFLGFGNDALIAISALMIAGQALVRTGALFPVGRYVSRAWKLNPRLAMLLMLISTAVPSAFMNNTPQVVLMIPILLSVAARSGYPPSKTLMPMTFAAQIGGTGTPIGTSLNLLVVGSAASMGVAQFGMFDFIVPAAIAGVVGLLYLWLIAPRLLPEREARLTDASPRVFTARMHIPEATYAVGKTLAEIRKKTGGEMRVVRVERPSGEQITPLPDVVVRAADRLVVNDTPERLKEFVSVLEGNLYSGDDPVDEEHPLAAPQQQTAELVVTRGSPLDGRSLNQVDFDERYKLTPLAIHRREHPVEKERADLHNLRLGIGDVLLVQGKAEQIASMKRSGELLVLDATSDVPHTRKAPLALAIMAGIVITASLGILPIVLAALLGVMLMIFTGCLNWRQAINALDAPMIFLTAAAIALSLALTQTGAAGFIAQSFVGLSSALQPAWILSGLILLMAIMASIVSNTAAAVIGTPIAVGIAQLLGSPPEPFILAVLFGVNMGYSTPMADNCNLLVYGAGGYRFKDFVRVGVPLMLLMWIAYSFLLPWFYPLSAVRPAL